MILIVLIVCSSSCCSVVLSGAGYYWDDLFGKEEKSGDVQSDPLEDESPEETPTASSKVCDPICKMPIFSPNKNYKLRLDPDGNLILTNEMTGKYKPTNIYPGVEKGPYQLRLQEDGHLIQSGKNNSLVWSSGVYPGKGSGPYKLKVQDDGNVVVYNNNSEAVWEWNTIYL